MGCESHRKTHQLHSARNPQWKAPYEVALETLGEDILKAFQLKPIEPDKVNLTPKLIRFNHL